MSKPKVLISDKLSAAAVEIFKNRGVDVDIKTGLKPEELLAIIKREGELVDEFKKMGLTVTQIDRAEFLDAVNKSTTFEQFNYRKANWEKIQAIK